MFPLGIVLLPGEVLPLHVFEPRYREMVSDCLADPHHEFGQVLIERGSETGGGDTRAMAGVVARMLRVGRSGDGRYALTTIGIRRFRVRTWLPDDPYPIADIDDWPDDWPGGADASAPSARIEALGARLHAARELAARIDGSPVRALPELRPDPVVASYQLVAQAPVGPADRYRMLCAPGPIERFDLLDAALDDVEAMLHFRLG